MPRHWSETLAREYLERLGYAVLHENYLMRGGEIDLVVSRDGVLVFVEVRQRSDARHGSAAESIDGRKIHRIRRAALHYLVTQTGRDDLPARFDVVLVDGSRGRHTVQHLENAF